MTSYCQFYVHSVYHKTAIAIYLIRKSYYFVPVKLLLCLNVCKSYTMIPFYYISAFQKLRAFSESFYMNNRQNN